MSTELCVVLLDVGPHMHPFLDQAARAVGNLVEGKMLAKPTHEVGLVFFGTTGTSNAVAEEMAAAAAAEGRELELEDRYDHITTQHGLAPLDTAYLASLAHVPRGQGASDFMEAIVVGSALLVGRARSEAGLAAAANRLVLLTNFGGRASERPLLLPLFWLGMRECVLDPSKAPPDEEELAASLSGNGVRLELEHEARPIAAAPLLAGAWPSGAAGADASTHTYFSGPLELGAGYAIKVGRLEGGRLEGGQVKLAKKTTQEKFPTLAQEPAREAEPEDEGEEEEEEGAEGGGGGRAAPGERRGGGRGAGGGGRPPRAPRALRRCCTPSSASQPCLALPLRCTRPTRHPTPHPRGAAPRAIIRSTIYFLPDDPEKKEIAPEERQRGVRYGSESVFMPKEMEDLSRFPSQKGLRLVGFIKEDLVPRAHYMKAVNPSLNRFFFEMGRRAVDRNAADAALEAAAAALPLGELARDSRRGVVRRVRVDPEHTLPDFIAMVANGDVYSALKGLVGVMDKALETSTNGYDERVVELAKAMREACIAQRRSGDFNRWLKERATTWGASQFRRAMWERLDRGGIMPIHSGEHGGSPYTEETARDFMALHRGRG
eukprot:scaffold14.g1039.t1